MAEEELVTSPDQHKKGHGKAARVGAIITIGALIAMLFGNNDVGSGAPWLIAAAALIALALIADGILRKNGLRS